MSKKIRDYLLIIFIILFIILTALISLYASGYKLNLSWPLKFNRFLEKTGMLAVATEPTRAYVYLNDKPQKNLSLNPWKKENLLTPTKIKNLLPGEYNLRLEQAGYWPYEQKIWINSGETTFIEDVNLFRENAPLFILAVPENKLSLSPDKKYLYTPAINKIITLKTKIVTDLNLPENISGTWLKNNKLMAAGIIFDPTKENANEDYAKLIGAEATNWYFVENTGKLYYQNNNSINCLETKNKTTTLIISGDNYLDYEPRQDKLFIINKKSDKIQLEDYSLISQKLQNTWILPNNGNYIFTKNPNGKLKIYDDQNKTLYLFDENNLSAGPNIIRNIKKWVMTGDESLIYINDFEIYNYNLQNNRADLITRRGEEINDIIWNQTGNYLIFSSEKTLNVLDFKNRNTTVLLKADKISSPAFDEKNNSLYFWALINQQAGIYKTLMQ